MAIQTPILRTTNCYNTTQVFFEEFGDFISEIFLSRSRCLFVGDFNIHVNDPEDADAALNDLFNTFSLSQMVSMPTHTSGNTLDWFLVRDKQRHN